MPKKFRREHAIIKLDIDKGMDRPELRSVCYRLWRAGYKVIAMSEKVSPGGHGWHITLELRPRPKSPLEVVAIQAILGSDPMREACNLSRANVWDDCPPFMRDRWNVLYV